MIVLAPEVTGETALKEESALSIAAENVSILKEGANLVFVLFPSVKEELKLAKVVAKLVAAVAALLKISSVEEKIPSINPNNVRLIIKGLRDRTLSLIPRMGVVASA